MDILHNIHTSSNRYIQIGQFIALYTHGKRAAREMKQQMKISQRSFPIAPPIRNMWK